MFRGCYTALITPLKDDGSVDYEGIEMLVEFQISQGASGVLSVGTTGESPTLSWQEHDSVTEKVCEVAGKRCTVIAGTGSNSTSEALRATEHAAKAGADAVLLVDPYYNGPSSLEIRREYVGPIAERFPEVSVIPYVIPGRTGTQLLPEDLAILYREHPNVRAVKEATGDLENMRRTRELCGEDFTILSGDDDKTFAMMTDPEIKASGVISVISNVAPGAVRRMTEFILEGKREEAEEVRDVLQPLFGIVTVKTQETTPYGEVTCRARNPLAIKSLMRILGMPSGPCRRPLGRMTRKGLEVVLEAARKVWREGRWVLEPVGEFFGVDLEERLNEDRYWEGLFYEGY